MSYDLFVTFPKKATPTAEAWVAAIADAMIPFTFDGPFDLTQHRGCLPGRLQDRTTAFEYSYTADYSKTKSAVIFCCHGDDEPQAALSIGAVLATLTGGKVEDPQDGTSLSGAKALAEARSALGLGDPDGPEPRPQLPGKLQLRPQDRVWCTFEPYIPLPWPSALPFDRDACLVMLRTVGLTTPRHEKEYLLKDLELPDNITAEEARFIYRMGLRAIAHGGPKRGVGAADAGALDEWARAVDIGTPLTVDEVRHSDRDLITGHRHLALIVYRGGSLELLLKVAIHTQDFSVFEGLRTGVLPFLTAEERAVAGTFLDDIVRKMYRPNMPVVLLGAMVGRHDLVAGGLLSAHRQQDPSLFSVFLDLIFGSGSRAIVIYEAMWRKMPLQEERHVRAWLATTGLTRLDWLSESIAKSKAQEARDGMLEAFVECVSGEAAALVMGELRSLKKFGAKAQVEKWFDDHPEFDREQWTQLGAVEAARPRTIPPKPKPVATPPPPGKPPKKAFLKMAAIEQRLNETVLVPHGFGVVSHLQGAVTQLERTTEDMVQGVKYTYDERGPEPRFSFFAWNSVRIDGKRNAMIHSNIPLLWLSGGQCFWIPATEEGIAEARAIMEGRVIPILNATQTAEGFLEAYDRNDPPREYLIQVPEPRVHETLLEVLRKARDRRG
jgi:hypothetical protein